MLGFRYEGCRAVLELHGLWTEDIVRGLQILERVTRDHKPRPALGTTTSTGGGRRWVF